MATVFSRLQHYCNQKNLELPDRSHRGEIGKQVIQIYVSEKKKQAAIERTLSEEPEGSVQAITYPRTFNPVIDQFIADYIEDIQTKDPGAFRKKAVEPVKKVRKKIPYKGTK